MSLKGYYDMINKHWNLTSHSPSIATDIHLFVLPACCLRPRQGEKWGKKLLSYNSNNQSLFMKWANSLYLYVPYFLLLPCFRIQCKGRKHGVGKEKKIYFIYWGINNRRHHEYAAKRNSKEDKNRVKKKVKFSAKR